jgi:hypothetical protein
MTISVPSAGYSRQNPSPRYRELLALYQHLHLHGMPEMGIAASDLFGGASLIPQLPKIKALVQQTGAVSLLDYGSGKGHLYRMSDIAINSGQRISTVRDYLGVARIVCFDPAVQEHGILPVDTFDGVISTDVLEHCPEEDMPWIIDEIFSRARKFVFANIASYPAAKILPNGENAHCTIQPSAWWGQIIHPVAARYPHIHYQFDISDSY